MDGHLRKNKMMSELVSVIVPAFNAENRIEDCINSIVNQTYSNIEIIIVNDGSTDNTEKNIELISKSNNKIHLFNIDNRGVSGARNYGINHSMGDLITFVDADDRVDSDYVEYLVNLYLKFHTDIVSCQHRVEFKNGNIVDNKLDMSESIWSIHEWSSDILARKNLDLSTVCKLYKRELFNDISFPEGRLFEDTSTTYKLVMKSSNIGVGNESKYSYILRNNSITRSKFDISYIQLITATDGMVNDLLEKYPDLKKQGDLRKSWARVSVMNSIISSGMAHEYKELLSDIRRMILKYFNVIMSKNNPDDRLKLVAIFLKLGIVPYVISIKIMQHIK